MILTRMQVQGQARWCLEGFPLPNRLGLSDLMEINRREMMALLASLQGGDWIRGERMAPIDPFQEVWAAGVTYQRSREARREESDIADIYDLVYQAERPELFFKALGWRVVGDGEAIRVRGDSSWNVPEPELVLVVNKLGEIIGYTAGNDVSSREIEGENPLYLPQAKVYRGSCALGPGIQLSGSKDMLNLSIQMSIHRAGRLIYQETASTASLKRDLHELVRYLTRELEFPQGVFLMTGTCLVPGGDFTLMGGDLVKIMVGDLVLENLVSKEVT